MDKWTEIAQSAWEAILSGVRKLRDEGKTYDEIAALLGIKNRALVGEWINGNREAVNAPFPNMLRYLDALGLSPSDFIANNTIKRMGSNSPVEIVDASNAVPVHVYAVAGAGQAWDVRESEPIYTMLVPKEYVALSSFALIIDGDSMYPTIKKGAIVGVSPDRQFRQNEVYAVRIAYEGIVVKRVAIDHTTKQYVLRSDNPDQFKYEPIRINIEEEQNLIIGRIVWICQLL